MKPTHDSFGRPQPFSHKLEDVFRTSRYVTVFVIFGRVSFSCHEIQEIIYSLIISYCCYNKNSEV